MSFPTISFNDLRIIHSKQIYKNASADNGDNGGLFNLFSNILDYKNAFDRIPKYSNGIPEYQSSKDILIGAATNIDDYLNKYISYSSMDEEERISKIIDFFDEINLLNSRTYSNYELRPILM